MARGVPSSGGSGDGDSVIPNLAAVKELWNMWEIHVLMLASLSLQVLLLFFVGIRRRSSSSILRGVLWLAYLLADSVAIFVLGHLLVHIQGPRHHLMYFFAPFVLVHLGGQDTITAFSKQDNELWKRHLLNLVTQVAMVGYVVAMASWRDSRLMAAMVTVFLSGCFKYAERIGCLYYSSPQQLSFKSMDSLNYMLSHLKQLKLKHRRERVNNGAAVRKDDTKYYRELMIRTLDMMVEGSTRDLRDHVVFSIMTEDAPHSAVMNYKIVDDLSDILAKFKSRSGRCGAYEYVGACLVRSYQRLYTKAPLRWELDTNFSCAFDLQGILCPFTVMLSLLCKVYQHGLALIALVLFMAAEKGDQDHTSRADITVSYILLLGAIILDICSFFVSPRYLGDDNRIKNLVLRVVHYVLPASSRKQWSEELAQYNMARTATQLASGSEPSLLLCQMGRKFSMEFFGFGTTTHIPVTKPHTPIKELILDHLLGFGTRKEWEITNSRGKIALQKWMDSHQDADDSTRIGIALKKSFIVDFPISVLVWHIATDMCYQEYNASDAIVDRMNSDNMQDSLGKIEDNMQVSRELSNYIMYLVFKCGVKRSTSSQFVHDRAHTEICEALQERRRRKDVNSLRYAMERFAQESDSEVVQVQKPKELADAQDSTVSEIQKQPGSSNLEELIAATLESVSSPVLPRAREVARELHSINDQAARWRLIFEVWSEMLYYIAPRCGSAFHQEHLTTGGEFVTHVLGLMQLLGPFLPPPSA